MYGGRYLIRELRSFLADVIRRENASAASLYLSPSVSCSLEIPGGCL